MTKVVSSLEMELMISAQISRAQDVLGDALRKSGLLIHPTLEVLEQHSVDLADAYVASLQMCVGTIPNLIVHTIRVNRTRNGMEAIRATGCVPYGDKEVIASMPNGIEENVTLHLMNFGRMLAQCEIETGVERIGKYRFADLFELAALNEYDPAIAGTHPNCTQLRKDGKVISISFSRRNNERVVFVCPSSLGKQAFWWFALVPI